jgi:dolichol-phosphate mannosyltransferase
MMLSVLVPARNEEGSITSTVEAITGTLTVHEIDHEVIVVDDDSSDATSEVVARIAETDPHVRYVRSPYRSGFGLAVRAGLEAFEGDAVAIMMADGSDHPDDLVAYHRLLEAGYDCAFGSRFIRGGEVLDYPGLKLVVNRLVNLGIRLLFGHGYNDTTNAFKAYQRGAIENIQPLLSHHFNLTVEMPLKAVVRGHSYAVVPIRWKNRAVGESKLRLQEMGSRYLFIVLSVFLEHHLSRGDYRRPGLYDASRTRSRWRTGSPAARVHEERAVRTRRDSGQ